LYVRGAPGRVKGIDLAVLPSHKPDEREAKAALDCIGDLARPGLVISVGYEPRLERPVANSALKHGAEVVIMFPAGIEHFRIRRDLQATWDENRVTVVSAV